MSFRISVAAALVVAAAALALVGCVDTSDDGTVAPPVAGPTDTPTAPPEIHLDGTASDNQAYFDQVNRALIAQPGTPHASDFIKALVAGGYPRKAMESTPDTTSIGGAADSIEFSVLFGSQCLIGQFGNVGYHSDVLPALQDGSCLIGGK